MNPLRKNAVLALKFALLSAPFITIDFFIYPRVDAVLIGSTILALALFATASVFWFKFYVLLGQPAQTQVQPEPSVVAATPSVSESYPLAIAS